MTPSKRGGGKKGQGEEKREAFILGRRREQKTGKKRMTKFAWGKGGDRKENDGLGGGGKTVESLN